MLQARTHSYLAGLALAITAAFFLILGFNALRHRIPVWSPLIPLPVAIASARRYRQYQQSRSKCWRLTLFYERALQRIQGEWIGVGPSGEEFASACHVYATDLNIVGQGSLFQLLCIARTAIGQRGLADYLLNSAPAEETLLRQHAIRELRECSDLREHVATLGAFDSLESRWKTFEDWLNSPPFVFPTQLRLIAALTSSLLLAILLVGLLGLVPWPSIALWAAPVLALHAGCGLVFRKRVNEIAAWVRPVSIETQVLRQGLQMLELQAFESTKLRALQEQVRNGSRSVRKLERLLDALNERQKEWFYIPSLLFMAGTQLCMAIEDWRTQHAASLVCWLRAWAEFEALNALAAYAYENPDNTFPEFTDEQCFEGRAIGHPLLPRESCVVNDICLNGDRRFYLISGSNMSGKSTLLRAIGMNTVLASAGAPVRAAALRMSSLVVFASLSIVDSLLNGKSRFMAEVERLSRTLDAARQGKSVLFLIDEILSGTNSRDRRTAAEAILRTLVDNPSIGALSTHDLALCEIAESDPCGINVHMRARDHGGPLDFDYLLKPGVTSESNALDIARMAGVPI